MAGFHDGKNTFYIGEFDGHLEESVLIPLTTAVKQQANQANGRIDLFVNSYGGNAHIMLHMIELIELAKRNNVTVRTMVTGAAYSAGSMIAVAGTPGERYIAKDAAHLVHYGRANGGSDATPLQVERNANATIAWFKQVVGLYNRYCNIPDLEQGLVDDDWYIPATSAKKWGMADKFMDKYTL